MKTRSLTVLLIIFLIPVLVGGLAISLAPYSLQKYLEQKGSSLCDSCRLQIQKLNITDWGNGVIFEDLSFSMGNEESIQYKFELKKISMKIKVTEFLRQVWQVEKIEVLNPQVTIIDGDKPSPKRDKPKFRLGQFLVRQSSIRDGSLTYIRSIEGRKARLHIKNINGEIGSIGSTQEERTQKTEAKAAATLEKSGKVELFLASKLFENPFQLDLFVKLQDQNLNDFTPFLRKNAGMVLKGYLVEGTGKIFLSEDFLTSEVYAKYKGFDLDFKKTKERTNILAYIMSLGSELFFDRNNDTEKKYEQTHKIDLTRKNESLVGFILNGLKEAAIQVAKERIPKKKPPISRQGMRP